jgi:TonB family protein
MDYSASDNKNRYFALGFALAFHGLLLLLFILIVFITPIPPFEVKPVPEIEIGLGMEGFGNTASGGSGAHDPDLETSPPDAAVSDNTSPPTADNVITDNTETDVAVKTNPNVKETPKAEELTPEQKKEREELEKALAKMKANRDKKGKGDGGGNTGGTGNGTNQGVGDGPGTGIGDGTPGGPGGTGWDLKGRSIIKKPQRMTDAEEEGIVVVEIIVDETGKVVKATAGMRGSTTQNARLYSKARSAAFEARFSPSPDGIKEQRGTYTFVFTLE